MEKEEGHIRTYVSVYIHTKARADSITMNVFSARISSSTCPVEEIRAAVWVSLVDVFVRVFSYPCMLSTMSYLCVLFLFRTC